ncbi:hypothetical protein M569_08820, partial [Genlisea aurea]
EEEEEEKFRRPRLCDFCSTSKALLYCVADSAKLCLRCDREVHSTNPLFKKHARSLLCDGCDSAASSIFCSTDSSVLCQNCDWESHDSFRRIHDRRPIEGYAGCPSVSELLNFLGLEDLGKKKKSVSGDEEAFLDFLVWETPSVVSLDDLIVPNDFQELGGHHFQAMGVPPLPKNRNAVCGKHKEDILNQLREMAATEPDFHGFLEDLQPDDDNSLLFHSQPPPISSYQVTNPNHIPNPKHSLCVCDCVIVMQIAAEKCEDGGADDESFQLADFFDLDHDAGGGESSDAPPQVLLPKLLNTQERDSALTRYKEKKKTRRYDKKIRYESRKTRAEGRMRIKGRFAKVE